VVKKANHNETNPVCDWPPRRVSLTHLSKEAKYYETRLHSSHSSLTCPHTHAHTHMTCNSYETFYKPMRKFGRNVLRFNQKIFNA